MYLYLLIFHGESRPYICYCFLPHTPACFRFPFSPMEFSVYLINGRKCQLSFHRPSTVKPAMPFPIFGLEWFRRNPVQRLTHSSQWSFSLNMMIRSEKQCLVISRRKRWKNWIFPFHAIDYRIIVFVMFINYRIESEVMWHVNDVIWTRWFGLVSNTSFMCIRCADNFLRTT